MKTETLIFNKTYINNIKKSTIIGTILLIFTPLLITYIIVRYTTTSFELFLIVYEICSVIGSLIILTEIFNLDINTHDTIITNVVISRGVYVMIIAIIAYWPLYNFITVNPFNSTQIKNMAMSSFKHYAIYQNITKKLDNKQINKLIKLKYIVKNKKIVKVKNLAAYNNCLHSYYAKGFNHINAKNKCSEIYTQVKTYYYVISKKGANFLTISNGKIYVNAAYQNFIFKKEPVKNKLIFKIFNVKKIPFNLFYPELRYSANMNVYSPTTKFYYKLTGKKYIFIGKKILKLYFSNTYDILNFKLSKITVS